MAFFVFVFVFEGNIFCYALVFIYCFLTLYMLS